MSDNTESLQLADELATDYYADVRVTAAAAELRRLHEENQQLRDQNTELDAACAKLEAHNAELVKALRLVKERDAQAKVEASNVY